MADVQTHFLDVLNDLYGKAAYPKGFASMLQGYALLDEEALRAAARKVVENHRTPPNLKTLQKMLASAQTAPPPSSGTLFPPYSQHYIQQQTALQREANKRAAALCRCGLGRIADKEGWLRALFDYALDHDRLPDEFGQEECRKLAQRTNNAVLAHKGLVTFRSKIAERIAMLDGVSVMVFGNDEALKHDKGKIFGLED